VSVADTFCVRGQSLSETKYTKLFIINKIKVGIKLVLLFVLSTKYKQKPMLLSCFFISPLMVIAIALAIRVSELSAWCKDKP